MKPVAYNARSDETNTFAVESEGQSNLSWHKRSCHKKIPVKAKAGYVVIHCQGFAQHLYTAMEFSPLGNGSMGLNSERLQNTSTYPSPMARGAG